MSLNSLDQLLDRLYYEIPLHAVKSGLANIRHLDRVFNCPSKASAFIQIAGTNGKGTVATKVAAAYREGGVRCGLFTSPHIFHYRERILIDDVPLSDDQLAGYLDQVFAAIDRLDIPATFFEVTTMVALLAFRDAGVEIGVLEVGLGGRLDATSVVDPVGVVITSIGLDHCDVLGGTIDEIAVEKGAIIRPGAASVVGPMVPQWLDADCRVLDQGSIALTNCELARALLRQLGGLSVEAIERGMEAEPPFRYERCGNLIIDVAHNPDALRELFSRVRAEGGDQPIVAVVGFGKGKDVEGCCRVVEEWADSVIAPRCCSQRLCDPAELAEWSEVTIVEGVQKALEIARRLDGQVVVTGSFYLLGEMGEGNLIHEKDWYSV